MKIAVQADGFDKSGAKVMILSGVAKLSVFFSGSHVFWLIIPMILHNFAST